MNIEILVTIAVIAFNSEKTILETLHSLTKQTYSLNNLEIIISDDGSTDKTLAVAEEWKAQHIDLFHSIIILSHEKNQGVTENCNQAWRAASGEWIKSIAADDILLSECIALNVKYISDNTHAKVLFSDMIPFTASGQESVIKHDKNKICRNLECQYKNILRECFLLAPTSFINRDLLIELGYGDNTYPMLDDYPLWLKCLSNGYKLDYLERETVLYRKGDSLSQQTTKIGNVAYLCSLYSFQKQKIWPLLPFNMFLKKWDDFILFYQKVFWIRMFGNQVNLPYVIYQKFLLSVRPYRLYCIIRSHLVKL